MDLIQKITKAVGWAIIVLTTVVVLIIGGLQTRMAKSSLTRMVQNEANKLLNAQLAIDHLDGNFLTRMELKGVLLTLNQDTVGYISELRLRYSLLPLLRGIIRIKSVELNNPRLFLTQNNDSSWNFSHITRPKQNPDTTASPFGMELKLEQLKINNGSIRLSTLDTIAPKSISAFYADLGFVYTQAEQIIDVRQIQLNAHQPDLTLRHLSFKLHADTASLRLEHLLLQTNINELKAEALVYPRQLNNSHVELKTAPIRPEEFRHLFPNLKIVGNPTLKLTAAIRHSSAEAELQLHDNKQGVSIQIMAQHVIGFLHGKQSTEPLTFRIKGDFQDLKLRRWINDPAMDYRLTGTWSADGSGTDYKSMILKIKGNFENITAAKRHVDRLGIALNYNAGTLRGKINGQGRFGVIRLDPAVKNVWSKSPTYSMQISTQRLDLSQLLLNNALPSRLTFNGSLTGNGIDPKTMSATFQGRFTNARIANFAVPQLDATIHYRRGNASGKLTGRGGFGNVSVNADTRRLMSDNPSYTAQVSTENLNLASLLGDNSFPSDLNLKLHITGTGFEPQRMRARVILDTHPSSLKGVNIRRLTARANYASENISIDTIALNTETIALQAQGHYSLSGMSDITLQAQLLNASEITQLFNLDSLETSGSLQARASGRADSLQLTADFRLGKTRIAENTVESAEGNADGWITRNDTTLQAVVSAQNLFVNGHKLTAAALQAKSNIRSTDFELRAEGPDMQAGVAGNMTQNEHLMLKLDELTFGYKGSNWRLDQPVTARVGNNEYEISELRLISGDEMQSNSMQIIHADGQIRKEGEQNLDLKLFNINIGSLLNLMNINQNVEGIMNMNMYVRGTADKPRLESGFNIESASVNDYVFDEVAGTIQLIDEKVRLDAGIIPKDSGLIDITGSIPFGLRLDSMKITPPTDNDSVNLRALVEKIPLRIIRSFYPVDRAEGYLQGAIQVNGTTKDPNPVGDFRITNGRVELKKYGIDYRQVAAAVRFEKEAVTVDTVLIRSRSGAMLANGAVGFRSQFYKGDIQNSNITINFNHFQPVDHKYYNMDLTGDISLQGKKDSVRFDGDVNILQALVYLPAVMNLMGGSKPTEIPLPALVTALERANQTPDSVIFRFRNTPELSDSVRFNYFDQVQGKIKVFIPRNTWIKNEQMRLELAGDVEIIKHRDFMELFGTVDVIRGQYELLGKTFVVDEGAITFQGGKALNPVLNIVASYSIRSQNQTGSKLTINVTGTLENPKVSFAMGGEALTEGDALSYILFGTNMDALTSGQEAAMNTSAGSLATGAAASLLSSELTKLLGKSLDVDYIEMRAGSSFENATFTVGKYITNKLFVSYERRFGDFKDEKVAEYEVKLEYELFRYLFLQLAGSSINNGADIIFKVNSKTKFKE